MNIHRAILRIRDRVNADGLLVEILQLCQFPLRAYKVRPAEKFTRHGTQLTPYDMFFGSVVTENFYILYSSLGAFTYAYLMIYRIAIYRSLHGFCLEKQIAIIHIQAIDITSFLGELFTQSLVKRFNIINIAFP